MIFINSVKIPTPSNFQVGVSDIIKETRNAAGSIIIEKIATKRKLEMSWNYLSNSDMSTILTAIGTSVFFTVQYPDPVTGAARSGTFYTGDRTAGAIDYRNSVIRWKDFKVNFDEQ